MKQVEIRWADLDPNFHVLHSRYYDFGAYCRMAFFVENGLTPAWMKEQEIGPILFREEAVFKKEIVFGDLLHINLQILKLTSDMGRWSMRHELYKNKETLAAIITVDGAWLNTRLRKLARLPAAMQQLFDAAPKATEFTMSGP
ncbi:MAG: thioesterase family protein [Gloeobacteraceae cyanobacterium ES-bin-316]|nr:thioesterase family protein [Ferruginibacter sp.]